jgi:argininosuccinate synthase
LLLFAYGSNLAAGEMARWAPGARPAGRARLDGFALALTRRSLRWGGGVVDLVEAPGEHVWGGLWELPGGALDALDGKEGAGFAYRRRRVRVSGPGGPAAAEAYEVIDKDRSAPPATAAYAALVMAGARERGLPESWLARLEGVLHGAGSVPAPMADGGTTSRVTASYEGRPGEVGRVLLLYSGGLDTSVMLKWIQDEYDAEVVALTVNLGQPGEDFEVVRGKALRLGALECHVADAREEFAEGYVLPAIKANALYGGGYPLFTALGRPLIAKLAVEQARASGCDTIAHGCTGKGNDQVRIESTVLALAPELKIIAPVRGWRMGREEEIAYAREHGIPVRGGTEAPPYSIDDNLWGRSSEGGPIEDLAEPPRDDVFQLVTAAEAAPDEPQDLVLEFERGRPVALDGERLGLVELLERAGEVGARHGVGIVDHVEDRIVGLKVRDLYEVPAAALVLPAHRELEKLVCTIHQNNFKPQLDNHWAFLVYAGLWHEPLLGDLNAYMESVNELVTGSVTMRLYKGSARPVARSSPHALYDRELAGFAESGGLFSQQASPGFTELWSLQSRMAYGIRNREGEGT